MKLKNEMPVPKHKMLEVNCGESFTFKDNPTEPMMKVSVNAIGCMVSENVCSYVSLRNGYVKNCSNNVEVENVGVYCLDT